MNLAALGDENVRKYGEYPSLAFEGREWTNVEQQRQANRLAHALVERGITAGDRVVVMLPNCPEVLQAYGGILRTGAVVVPIIFLLNPEEVRHILADSGAKLAITSPELAGKLDGWDGQVVVVGGEAPRTTAWDELLAREPD